MAVDLELLGRTLKQAQYRNHRTVDRRLAEIGTTLVQWDMLRAIARTPGATGHALATATFQGDQAFGTLSNRLVEQGLIERRRGHGRAIEHHLTKAGEAMLAAGRAIARDELVRLFAPLSEGERATLLELLQRLVAPGPADSSF